jgi:hypothetical protein
MRGNNRKGIILQDRDRHLLRELGVMRVIDREQAKIVAGFGSTTRANTRLLALTRAGFLRRYFLGTVGGARKSLYLMSEKGAELVGVPYRGPRRVSNQILAADFFAMHQLEINDVYCILKYRPAPESDMRLARWESFYQPVASGTTLIPDGYAEIASPQKTIAAFLEIDRGNEARSVWQRKVEAYLAYALSGSFARRFGRDQFRVIAVANSEGRMASLRRVTARTTEKIFWFTSREAMHRDGFWSAIWLRPTGDARQQLF